MAARPYRLIGVYDCWSCQEEVPVRETDQGTVGCTCPWCDFRNWAPKGTEHNRKLRAALRPLESVTSS